MFKKLLSSLVLLALSSWLIPSSAFANGPLNAARMEGVLVVDVSKSMLESDPNKLSNEAMKMFIDMSSLSGDKVGFVAYAGEVMHSKELVTIRSEQDKKSLKDFIDSIDKYPNTDLSVGVKEAIRVLDSGHEKDHFPLIVLLADGNNDLNEKKQKTVQQAEEELAAAVADAKAKGYPIYTIGLNANGKLNKDILNNIATSTNGKFFETNTADTLPTILSEIYAAHSKLKISPVNEVNATGDFQEVKFNVPNANVLETNISIQSKQPVELKLVDPAGTEQSIPSDNILLTTSKSYSMLKLINPVQGEWILKVKGIPQDQIDINLVFNYDFELKLAPLSKQMYEKGETVSITAFLEDNGKQITNKELYKTMNATLFVKNLESGKIEEVKLTAGDQGFTGPLTLADSVKYEVFVRAEDNSFYRETTPETLEVQKDAVPVVQKVNQSTVEKPKSEQPNTWLYVVIAIIGAIILSAGVFAIVKRKKANGDFKGKFVVEVKDEKTGELSQPRDMDLRGYKGKFSLHQLLSKNSEPDETDKILFISLAGDTLLLLNQSCCKIEKGNEMINAESGQRLKRDEQLRIILDETNTSIFIKYIA